MGLTLTISASFPTKYSDSESLSDFCLLLSSLILCLSARPILFSSSRDIFLSLASGLEGFTWSPIKFQQMYKSSFYVIILSNYKLTLIHMLTNTNTCIKITSSEREELITFCFDACQS